MSLGSSNTPGSGLYRPQADINVTPLVDVMLVLLIIFMVTAPMLATGLKIDLPQAKQALPLNPKEPVVITVAKDARLSLGSDVIGKDQLIAAVHDKLEGDMNRTIHLRGDKEVPFGDIVAIMDLLASNGLTHIAIVADARTKPDVAPVKPAASVTVGNDAGPDTANVKPVSGQPVVAEPQSGVEGGAK